MTDEFKKPSPVFQICVAASIAAFILAGYPLRFGPACWLVPHGFLPLKATWHFFRPITLLANEGPEATACPIYW